MSGTRGEVVTRHDGSQFVRLSASSFNVDKVRRAFEEREERKRSLARLARRAARQAGAYDDAIEAEPALEIPYRYVREAWTDFLVVETGLGNGTGLVKVPYTVGEGGEVTFGSESPVEQVYQEVGAGAASLSVPSDEVSLSHVDDADRALVVALGSSASLDRSPKKNWVENAGGLPPYVREVARSIEKTGKTLEQAIQIAIGRIKVWAATGKGDTKAKAAKALAQWEALKAKNGSKKVAASNTTALSRLTAALSASAGAQVERDLKAAPTHGEDVVTVLEAAAEEWETLDLSALRADEDSDPDAVELHGQKSDPGYEYLHSPNPKVAAAANRIFAAARKKGLSVKQAQAAIPHPAAWKSAHERDGGNKKLLSGDSARAAQRRGEQVASQTIGGNKTGSTRPWQTGDKANATSYGATRRTRRKGGKKVSLSAGPEGTLSLSSTEEHADTTDEMVPLSIPSHAMAVEVGEVYQTKSGGLTQMLPTKNGYAVTVYPKGSTIEDGEVATETGSQVEILEAFSETSAKYLLKNLATK